MPARASFTITDGESTPVSHIFTPNGDNPNNHGEAWFARINANPVLTETVKMVVKDSTDSLENISKPGYKCIPRSIQGRISLPYAYTDPVSGLVLLDYTNYGIFDLKIHPRSSAQAAKNLRTLLRGVMYNALFDNVYDVGERIW